MIHYLFMAIAIVFPFQEPVKAKPAKDWLWLFTLDDPDANSFAEWDKFTVAAPALELEFEAIMNDPMCNPRHLSGLYGFLGTAKVDRKKFFKLGLRDLNHANGTVRLCAASFVGDAGGGPEFAAPLLMLMLHDPDVDVCNAARRSLGKVGDASTMVALEHLICFGTGKPGTPKQVKESADAFAKTRDQIKARLAAAAKAAPAPPK